MNDALHYLCQPEVGMSASVGFIFGVLVGLVTPRRSATRR